MPLPRKKEKKDDFIKRCIPQVVGEGRSQKEAIAICYALWEKKDNK